MWRSLLLGGFLMLGVPCLVSAQFGNATVAKTYLISGEPALSGDLVSFDKPTQSFHITRKEGDKNLLGVVVSDPVIVLRTITEGTPIVSSGEVYVNVTSENGPIKAGEDLSSSAVPGKAKKASSSTTFIVGTALEAFPNASTTPQTATQGKIYQGSIRVLLAIGQRDPGVAGLTGHSGTVAAPAGDVGIEVAGARLSTPLALVIRYTLAILVIMGTVYLAFRNFSANLKDSVVSVGRNPLAKASIQSMTLFNTLLIFIMGAAGLFIAYRIVFLPI
jgi:hypothetical protein